MRIPVIALGCIFLGGMAPQTGIVQGEDAQAAKAVSELWFGELDVESRKIRFVLELTTGTNGSWSGELLSLDEGDARFPLTSLVHDKGQFTFALEATGATFDGRLDEEGHTISGKWKQRGMEFELVFKRVDESPNQPLKKVWIGELNLVLQKLKLAIRELENGEVLFDSLTQRAGGFVASKTLEGNQVAIDVPAIKGTFRGKYNDDQSEIVGYWTQGIVPLPLTFRAADPSELRDTPEKPQRPQTPQPPFPYQTLELVIANPQAPRVQLAATLSIPTSAQPVPAVVLISGSGPQDRDETIAGHKPFWVIADHLSRNGIAVLRFDDRGVGESQGDHSTATSVDLASDVEAIIAHLRTHPGIDPRRLGLCGHSEGALISCMVAARDSELAFVVLLAGPGVDGEQILTSQMRQIQLAQGADPAEVTRQLSIQSVFLELSRKFSQLEQAEFIEAAQARLEPLMSEAERSANQAQLLATLAAAQVLNPWFRSFIDYDPADDLQRLRCPVLAITGDKDVQVVADLNMAAMKQAFAASGNQHTDVRIAAGLNHLLQPCTTGNIDEYQLIEQTLDPSVLTAITAWILAIQ